MKRRRKPKISIRHHLTASRENGSTINHIDHARRKSLPIINQSLASYVSLASACRVARLLPWRIKARKWHKVFMCNVVKLLLEEKGKANCCWKIFIFCGIEALMARGLITFVNEIHRRERNFANLQNNVRKEDKINRRSGQAVRG